MKSPALRRLLLPITLILAGHLNAQPAATEHRFEKIVRTYEVADKSEAPPNGAILLAGDSQFYRWKTLREDLPEYTFINRGIDSLQLPDLLHYTDRLVLPYKPRLIFLHIGGNDIHQGRSPADMLADFRAIVAKVRAVLPGVTIVFSSLTPGPGRWDEAARRQEVNWVFKNYIATQPDLRFIDLWDAMLTADGKPREDLWGEDRIHPNHAGYLLRAQLMRPLLGEPDRKRP